LWLKNFTEKCCTTGTICKYENELGKFVNLYFKEKNKNTDEARQMEIQLEEKLNHYYKKIMAM